MGRDELNAHLDRVLIGGRERVTITIVDYDPVWPVRFERERTRIEVALTDGVALRIEHIGSREPAHRMFRAPQHDVHVHVWADDDPEADRYLAFRDRLRTSSADRAAYKRLKRELASREWEDMNHYAEAKNELIEPILVGSARR